MQNPKTSNTAPIILAKKHRISQIRNKACSLNRDRVNSCTHCSNLFIVTDVTAHQEGCRGHDKVQHSSRQDRNIGLLPGQRLEETSEGMKRRIGEIK